MKQISFSDITVTGGFWKTKQELVRRVTVHSVYKRFAETHRFDALRCQWARAGQYEGHIFWDSDVAKWIEGAACLLSLGPAPELEALCDEAIAQIVKNAEDTGYFNSYFLSLCPEKRFTDRSAHELYCAGHLMEAAVAYRDATGKTALLDAMCRYADYIEKIFKIEGSAAFVTPGHPELELALVRLYHATGEKRYLELAKFFIDQHGANPKDQVLHETVQLDYNMDRQPLRQITQPDGHAVRALYLLCGMIDVAAACEDRELADSCRRAFDSIVSRRMYITGGLGSTYLGEAFTTDYHLPGRTAYAETCASIALALFAGRLQNFEPDSRYADTLERALYNGILSGLSMDGKSFFYENPLEIDPDFNDVCVSTTEKERMPITQRLEVFDCSCCPPNLLRLIPSVGNFLYGTQDGTLYVHQYMDSEGRFDQIHVIQKTRYPSDGVISITAEGPARIGLRIPGWCRSFRLNRPYTLEKGYALVELSGKTELLLELDMPVALMEANRRVHDCAGRVAVTRGPVVYCIEGVDNGKDLRSVSIDPAGSWTLGQEEFLLPELHTAGYRPQEGGALYRPITREEEIPLKFIPYYAFANRGTSEMQVWILKK